MMDDVRCNEMIVSNDYGDFILTYSEKNEREYGANPNVCVVKLSDKWLILYGPFIKDLNFVVSDYGYLAIPKLYALMDTTSMEASGITKTINQPVLATKGEGVIIGFIDTGIDYTLDIFQFAKGITKIEAIWDQTGEFSTDIGENGESWYKEYKYGRIYNSKDINEALRAQIAGGNPYDYVSQRDTNGHGTFVAGIAAGARDGSDFTGAAPQSSIVMVKLKEAKQYLRDFYIIKEDAIAYQETDIMLGIKFLTEYAARHNKPLVICNTLGSNSGPHSQGTPLGQIFADVSTLSNTVAVTCTGNEANERLHYYGVVSQQFDTMEINVGNNEPGFTMEIWGKSPDIFSVAIVSPTGEQVPRIPARAGRSSEFGFLFDNTKVFVDYKITETVSGQELILIKFQKPSQGIWRIKVYVLAGITRIFNAWLPVREFVSNDVYFLESSPDTTLTEPSATPEVISVGAYNHTNGSLYINSGRGYTADLRVKPDICAPGVEVYGPKSGGGYTYRSGTSIAAAHVAGASALVMTWELANQSSSSFNTVDIKNILIRGAKREVYRVYPNPEWGYGTLDLYNSFELMRIQ